MMLRTVKRGLVLASASSALLGFVGAAWGQIQPKPVHGPIRHVQIGSITAKSTPKIIYSNTTFTGLFSRPGTGGELIDWGTIVSSEDHDTVTDVSFGYATYIQSTSVRYRVYDGYTGFCSPIQETVLDISLTGLPGSSTGLATGWIVSLDLNSTGNCFFLEEGPFGYSWTMSDDFSGPIIATGGTGTDDHIDFISAMYPCTTVFFFPGSLYTEFGAWDGNDTFPGGCGGGLALEFAGSTCSGSTASVTISGAAVGDWWAVVLGITIGSGVGGTLGGCPIDVDPLFPIAVMGPLPAQPLTIPVGMPFVPGLTLGVQVITKHPSANLWDSSNTELINVP